MGAISHHPHVVPVYAVGTTGDGRPYLVMPYLPGGTLGDRLGTLSWRQAVDLGAKMSGALQAAHDVGLLHRDVKPANILWSAWDEPQLADFGIARLHDATRTAPGLIVASLTWAAPEVLEGKPASPASDVYSLAASLHAAIVGRSPYAPGPDEPLATTVARIASQPAPDLTPFGVPRAVSDVIANALAKDPARRPLSARAFGEALAAAAAAETTGGPAPAPVPAVEPLPLVEPARSVEQVPVVESGASAEVSTQPPVPSLGVNEEQPLPQAPALPPTIVAQPQDEPAGRPIGRSALRSRPTRRRRSVAAAVVGGCLVGVLLALALRQVLVGGGGTDHSASGGRRTTSSAQTSVAPSAPGGTSGPGSRGSGQSRPTTPITSPSTDPATTTAQRPPRSSTSSTTGPLTTSSVGTTTPMADPVRATLVSYYDLVGQGAYGRTWPRLTADYQRRVGGYDAYSRFWRSYDRVEVSNVRADGDLGATATVRYFKANGAVVEETGRFRFIRSSGGQLAIDEFRVSSRNP